MSNELADKLEYYKQRNMPINFESACSENLPAILAALRAAPGRCPHGYDDKRNCLECCPPDTSAPDLAAVPADDRALCMAVMRRCVERLGAGFMEALFAPQFNTPWDGRFDALLKSAPDDVFTEARAALPASSAKRGDE